MLIVLIEFKQRLANLSQTFHERKTRLIEFVRPRALEPTRRAGSFEDATQGVGSSSGALWLPLGIEREDLFVEARHPPLVLADQLRLESPVPIA